MLFYDVCSANLHKCQVSLFLRVQNSWCHHRFVFKLSIFFRIETSNYMITLKENGAKLIYLSICHLIQTMSFKEKNENNQTLWYNNDIRKLQTIQQIYYTVPILTLIVILNQMSPTFWRSDPNFKKWAEFFATLFRFSIRIQNILHFIEKCGCMTIDLIWNVAAWQLYLVWCFSEISLKYAKIEKKQLLT